MEPATSSVLLRYIDAELLGQLRRHPLQPRDLVVGRLAGAHRSPLSGFAVEFIGHRQYVVGDDPRHIDWRVFFGRDKLVVKQYELETNLVGHFLLDCSGSMAFGAGSLQKLDYAKRLAATLACAVVQAGDQVSCCTFRDRVRETLPPGNSLAQLTRLCQLLAATEPAGATRWADSVLQIAPRLGRRGIVVLVSDLLGDLAELDAALQRLRYDRHQLLLAQVLHRAEAEFPYEGELRYTSLEAGDSLAVEAREVAAAYRDEFVRHQDALRAIADRHRAELLTVFTDEPLADALEAHLTPGPRRR